jgi:hypothetical protein
MSGNRQKDASFRLGNGGPIDLAEGSSQQIDHDGINQELEATVPSRTDADQQGAHRGFSSKVEDARLAQRLTKISPRDAQGLGAPVGSSVDPEAQELEGIGEDTRGAKEGPGRLDDGHTAGHRGEHHADDQDVFVIGHRNAAR